ALFGPTVRGFGFYPLGEDDRVIELEIECRPCSLHGGDHCPKGHFNCMEGIAPDRVQRALLDIIDSGKAP
ncbi:MAG: lipopolysaccharide heptosyltransferase II, partial [Deltaproteobacteria bacterium]